MSRQDLMIGLLLSVKQLDITVWAMEVATILQKEARIIKLLADILSQRDPKGFKVLDIFLLYLKLWNIVNI